LRNPVACGGLGAYDPDVVADIAGLCEVPMDVAHRDPRAMLMLDRDPLRWRGRGVRGFAWTESTRPTAAKARSWRDAATNGNACGLVTTRDRSFLHSSVSGASPVFYLSTGDAIYFATRLDALARGAGVPLSPDWDAWVSIFCLRSPVGDQTTFAEIKRLDPLTTVEQAANGPKVRSRKWPWAFEPELTLAEGIGPLCQALDDSLAPLDRATSLLSAGLDSRILAGILSRHGADLEALTSIEDDGGKRSEHEMTVAVAAAVGARHRRIDRDHDRNWDDWVQRITECEFMLYGNAGLVPLFPHLEALERPAVDGLALDTFSVRGERFYTAEMFEGSKQGSRAAGLSLWRSIRRHKAPGVPAKAFEPGLARRIARGSRRQFLQVNRPFRGNSNELVLDLYRTRTMRGVATVPTMLGRHTRVYMPATNHRVAMAFLAIKPQEKVGFKLYDAMLERLVPTAAKLPTSATGINKRPQFRPQARFSPLMVDRYQALLSETPLRPHFSPELGDAVAGGNLDVIIENPGYHRAIMLVATFELWSRRYERQLGSVDVSPLIPASEAAEAPIPEA
jgi:hypothetical protein